jgi:hypothetical protein
MTAAAMASLFFLAAFLGGREAAVSALPDLAGLYAAVGLPINLDGLAIENVTAERNVVAGGEGVTVQGTIRNVSGTKHEIPPLAAILYDSAMIATVAQAMEPPSETLAPGSEASFEFSLTEVPERVSRLVLRFRRPGEAIGESPGQVAAAE